MGVPVPDMEPVENASAEALLSSLESIAAAERRKHASVFNYWLSIKGEREFPPIRDLDPLEISEAGPSSVLLEMIGGGEDAIVRHFGNAIRMGLQCDQIAEAPSPSLLACIRGKLPLVAACKQSMAFEDRFETDNGPVKCWITLLPFSASGNLIDFVYGLVSLDPAPGEAGEAPEDVTPEAPEAPQAEKEPTPSDAESAPEPFRMELHSYSDTVQPDSVEDSAELDPPTNDPIDSVVPKQDEPVVDQNLEPQVADPEPEARPARPGLSAKLFESLASVGDFYGKITESAPRVTDVRQPEPAPEPESEAFDPAPVPEAELAEPDAEEAEDGSVEAQDAELPDRAPEPVPEPDSAPSDAIETKADSEPEVLEPNPCNEEGSLQSKLTEVRDKADEAQQAKLRAHAALVEGLSAAYDFALDAEQAPEEYLRLVEAKGLKIQLRSPMQPVVKLAFEGTCDDSTVADLEAVLAWALKQDLPRGTLVERIEAEGGIAQILKSGSAVN